MTADAGSPPAFPQGLNDLLHNGPDEFDLDIRWGELDQASSWTSYLPTAREVPGETCDTRAATCPDTCHDTCPATCHDTCPATCHATCQDTCGRTCADLDTCGGTCANTHCFTCRSDCGPR